MKKIIELFNFLTIGAFLSTIILFIGDFFGFSLGINFQLLWRVLAGFLALTVLLNTGNIKKLLKVSTTSKKFLLLSGLNVFLFALFLLFYPIFRFGSPFVWEDRIANFKAAKRIEITLNEPLKQNFQAKSNNLGTIGLRIISKDVVIEEESEEATTGAELTENEETGAVQGINIGEGELDEELDGELYFGEPERIVFRIKEEEKKDYFYENTYELNQYWETNYFLFGLPIQKDSEDKNYVFEIEKTKEGETNKVFLIEKNSQGGFNFYPRYVYNFASLKTDWDPILLNISRKTTQFLEEKTNQFNLIFFFFLIEFLIFIFLKKEREQFKEKINFYLKYGFLIVLLLITISSLKFEFIQNIEYLQNFINNLSKYSFPLTLLTITLGFLLFYFNREKIQEETEKEENEEKLAEGKRLQEFPQRFPKISKIPVLRNIVRLMYKEGWYLIVLIFIVLWGIFLRISNIEYLSIWYDEAISVSVAKNIASGIGPILISGVPYKGAFLFHQYLSLFYRNNTEVINGIFANIPFFIITAVVLFYFGKELKNKKAGIIASFLFAFSWVGIAMGRDIRFYEMFICFFTLGSYFFYRSYIYFLKIDGRFDSKKTMHLVLFVFLSGLFLCLSFTTQLLTFFVLYSFALFGFILIIKSNVVGYLVTSLSFLMISLGNFYKFGNWSLGLVLERKMPDWFNKLYDKSNYLDFFIYLLKNDYFYLVLIIGILIFFILFRKSLPGIFLLSMIIGLYSMVANYGVGYPELLRYFYYIFPFLFLATGYFFVYFKELRLSNSKKIYNFLLNVLLLFILLFTLYSGIVESNSPKTLSSKYMYRNIPYKKISEIIFEKRFEEYIKIGDNSVAFVTCIYTNKNLDYFLDRRDVSFINAQERHTRISAISHVDLDNMINTGKKILLIYDEKNIKPIKNYLESLENSSVIYEKIINRSGDKIVVMKFN
jgi:hypothetical protein